MGKETRELRRATDLIDLGRAIWDCEADLRSGEQINPGFYKTMCRRLTSTLGGLSLRTQRGAREILEDHYHPEIVKPGMVEALRVFKAYILANA